MSRPAAAIASVTGSPALTARQIRSSASGKTSRNFARYRAWKRRSRATAAAGAAASPRRIVSVRVHQPEIKQEARDRNPGQKRDRDKVQDADAIAGSRKLGLHPGQMRRGELVQTRPGLRHSPPQRQGRGGLILVARHMTRCSTVAASPAGGGRRQSTREAPHPAASWRRGWSGKECSSPHIALQRAANRARHYLLGAVILRRRSRPFRAAAFRYRTAPRERRGRGAAGSARRSPEASRRAPRRAGRT